MKKYTNWYWLTVLGLLVFAFISRAVAGSWLSGFFLIPATLSVLMTLFYFGVWGFSQVDLFWSSGGTETFGLLENNGALVDIIMFSDKFHVSNDWKIEEGKSKTDPDTWLEHELNATWIGMPWNRQFRPVVMNCHRWKKEERGRYIEGGTERKSDHNFERYTRLFHTHAYVTDTIEIAGNFHVKGGFNFRFRISNPYLAFYQTADVVDMLNTVALSVTRQDWSTMSFDQLRESVFETQGSERNSEALGVKMKKLMNKELANYGVLILEIHLVDLMNTDQDEADALKEKKLKELRGDANIMEAEKEAKAILITATAQAEAEEKVAGAFFKANNGDHRAMTASALSRMKELKAFGSGSSLLIDDKDDSKPKIIKP